MNALKKPITAAICGAIIAVPAFQAASAAPEQSYIVQADSVLSASQAVVELGGSVTRALDLIDGVEASLTRAEHTQLSVRYPTLRVLKNDLVVSLADDDYDDDDDRRSKLKSKDKAKDKAKSKNKRKKNKRKHRNKAKNKAKNTNQDKTENTAQAHSKAELTADTPLAEFAHAPTLIGANALHDSNVDGRGVAIALLDSGFWDGMGMERTVNGEYRILAEHSSRALTGFERTLESFGHSVVIDEHGHGTHVASVAASSERLADGRYMGVAPMQMLLPGLSGSLITRTNTTFAF